MPVTGKNKEIIPDQEQANTQNVVTGTERHQVKYSHLNLLGTCLPFSSLPDKNLPVFLDWHCFQDFHFLFFPIYLFLYFDILVVMCVGIDFLTLLLFGNGWIVWMCMLIFTIHFGKF